MAEILPRDILVRAGGRTLSRGVLAWGGANRADELKEAITRTTTRRFRDSGPLGTGTLGNGRTAAAGNVALDYASGLVDQFSNPLGGPLIHEARTQILTAADTENFVNWAPTNGPVLGGGQNDPFGGALAYSINDNSAAAEAFITHTMSFTGDGEKCIALFARQGTSPAFHFGIHNGSVWRHGVDVTWGGGGVPSVATQSGSGTRFVPVYFGGNWWLIAISLLGVVAADANTWFIRPCIFGVGNTGSTIIFGANAWDKIYPTSYQGPADSPFTNGDSIKVGINFGRIVCSLYVDMVERTVHQASSDNRVASIGASSFTAPYFAIQGQATNGYRAIFDNGGGLVTSGLLSYGAFGDRVRMVARLYADGSVELERRINTAAASVSTRSAASTLTAGPWSGQFLWLNGGNGAPTSLDQRVIHDEFVVRDTRTLAECEAVP